MKIKTSLILVFFCSVIFAQHPKPIAHWSFDEGTKKTVKDIAGDFTDRIQGYMNYKEGVTGKSLKFDVKSTSIVRTKNIPDLSAGKFTFEAWIAQQAYPLNWAPGWIRMVKQYMIQLPGSMEVKEKRLVMLMSRYMKKVQRKFRVLDTQLKVMQFMQYA